MASIAFAGRAGLVLIDPLIVDDWPLLDGLASPGPVDVVLAAPWHQRSAAEIAARYDARIFVHHAGRDRVSSANVRTMSEGEVLPGVEVFPVAGADDGEVVIWLPKVRTLITAEVLTGSNDGLRVALSPSLRSREELWNWVSGLLQMPVNLVLPAHGPPVLHDGITAIRTALTRPPW